MHLSCQMATAPFGGNINLSRCKSLYQETLSPFKHMDSGSVNLNLETWIMIFHWSGELSKVHLPALDFLSWYCTSITPVGLCLIPQNSVLYSLSPQTPAGQDTLVATPAMLPTAAVTPTIHLMFRAPLADPQQPTESRPPSSSAAVPTVGLAHGGSQPGAAQWNQGPITMPSSAPPRPSLGGGCLA